MVRKVAVIAGVVVALVFSLVGPVAMAAQPPEKVDVLIRFDRQPGPSEEGLVHGAGGCIKYTYHLVPAIAASVPEAAIQGLSRNPRVTIIEPDIAVYATDGELDDTWGVKHIGAGTVHDAGNKGAAVKIAIIDSGIDYTHPDLSANYVGGYDFVNDDLDPMDDYGHGTHVAGTVAAADNGFGVVGAAPEAEIYALKVLDSNGSGYYRDVIAALQWAVDNGIQITNNSYGSSLAPESTVEAAFDAAYAAGVLHVAAAGNSGNPPGKGDNVEYPARWESVIAVAATDQSDSRAKFSCTGSAVELSAPGVQVNSTLLGGGYGEGSGTSMASPHVAGTAALVIAAGITANNDELRQRLVDTAYDLGVPGLDAKYGYGLVDAVAAAAGVSPPPPPPPPPGETMSVESIVMSTDYRNAGRNIFLWAIATVTIVNESGAAVEGAIVDGHWEGATTDSDSGATDTEGRVSLQSDNVKNPPSGTTFTFVVDNVAKEGWTWAESPGEKRASITP